MRKTYDLKQVKISTSILWLLNKAETRSVFLSSSDIFSNKIKLHLHSLIIRGLISGELYCAALSKLFPCKDKPIRTKDFQSVLDFLIEDDRYKIPEVAVLQEKNRGSLIGSLTKLEPFELSEHLQVIDAIMAIYLESSEIISSIPSIVGKLCNYRPNVKDGKKLLEIWFKTMTCLSLSENNIQECDSLIKRIITQENIESNEKVFLDSIKFSDKVALILSYESDALEIEKEFIFDFSNDGSTNRDNVKHNFITVIHIFRKYFPKVLEDFKELMLVLNSSHIQISSNLIININLFILEFFTLIEDRSNHGNRTFRTGSKENTSRTFRIENPNSSKEQIGVYHSLYKPASQINDKYSKSNAFGTYSGRKPSQNDYANPTYEELSMNWSSNKVGNNLLYTNRKSSVPNGLNWTGVNKTVSSNLLLSDGTLKSKFLGKINNNDSNKSEKNDINKTSWLLENEKLDKNNKKEGLSDQENEGPRLKVNETRLMLNLKRQEIEENRKQINQQLANERRQLSDKIFKDVTMGISQSNEDDVISYRPKRVSDMKRSRIHQNKPDLVRSRSQDISKASVEDINISLNQLKSEISKLTSEQARLSAKIAESKIDSVEAFSPRLNQSTLSREDGFDGRATERASIRSMPVSWHPYNNYGIEDSYNNFNMSYGIPYPYSNENSSREFKSPSPNIYPQYHYGYPPENSKYQIAPPVNSISNHHTSKSLHDTINSRPSSPGAMSEPSKNTDIIPEKSIETVESEPLTIQNLIKHNKSMEKLPKDLTYSENHSTKSLIQNTSEKKPGNLVNDSITKSSISNSIQKFTNTNDDSKKSIDNDDITKRSDTSGIISQTPNLDSMQTSKSDNFNEQDKNIEASKLFFVSIGDEKTNKKPFKKPKIRYEKDSNNNNNNDNNNNNKSDHMVNGKNTNIINNSETKGNQRKVEKPLAFVVTVDDDKPMESINDNFSSTKDKILHLTEKREQERKEKMEKIREITRIENEKRMQKEFEKVKIKEERKLKREAIFEAHLEKKLEKETADVPNRKEIKIIKRPIRAMSAMPFQQKNEFQVDANQNICSPSEYPNTDLSSLNYKRDKVSVTLPGPKLFVEPKVKSNKNVILNAIKYCCLAGKVNETLKVQTLEELERFDASHFMILMRGGCQYRSLYRFEFDSECLTKLSGIGPKKITNKMVDKFFKYNSGAKKFMEITSTNHLSTVIDGITIFNTLWKANNPPSSQMNSETSSQAEHPSQ